jgi:16S rRNA (uracil1498-N3)-methyltransferase
LTTARFYVSERALREGILSLEGAEHHHASRVLRMRVGEKVILLDGRGGTGYGTIRDIDAGHTSIVVESTERALEEHPRLHLYQGLPRSSKMDEVVQRGVEIGAASLHPFTSSRSRTPHGSQQRRVERWRRIALESSRVAGRPFLPEVYGLKDWDEALRSMQDMADVLFADEAGGIRPASALQGREPLDLALVVGPEGGFTPQEREDLLAAGARAVTLGTNCLLYTSPSPRDRQKSRMPSSA